MKILSKKSISLALLAILIPVFTLGANTFAETSSSDNGPATSISISPVSNVLSLSGGNAYNYEFNVSSESSNPMTFEVYAAPYSYTFSEADNEYKLGFARENNYTEITRWISFKDASGNYVPRATFTAPPKQSVKVEYRITTPASIPAGGQYAVIFAHTINSNTSINGIKTEASPGLVIYAHATGETKKSAELSDLSIEKQLTTNNNSNNAKTIAHINASAKVKNTGNIDFPATGILTVKGVFGGGYYETPIERARILVIPESERVISDEWKETPYFGLFKVTWKVTATDKTETITRTVLLLPVPIIILTLILLTIIAIWVIFSIKRRKERRARLSF